MTTPARRPLKKRGSGKLSTEREKAAAETTEKKSTATGIHALDPEEGELFECEPLSISPNPMNRRLALGDMDEMVASVARQGVHTPGAVMHMELFLAMYPEWADLVSHPERRYILGPGHRRHAAAQQAGKPMLVILRNKWAKSRSVEENLISENEDRVGLSPVEQALQLDLLRQRGFTTEQIAERSSYGSKGTVSRYLNLLDLPPEIQTVVHEGHLSHKAAYVLSTIKDDEDSNSSPAAHELQRRALGWMSEEGLSAEAAKNRLKQQAAFPAGNATPSIAVPDSALGSTNDNSHQQHDAGAPEQQDGQPLGKPDKTPANGKAPIPMQAQGSPAPLSEPEVSDAAAAAKVRALACQILLTEERYASAEDMYTRLVDAVLNPEEWKPAAALAHAWLRELGKGPDFGRPSKYVAEVAASKDTKLKRRVAYAIGLAADELRAAQPDRTWDDRDRAHLQLLMTSKAAYQPTEWEQRQLGLVSPEH
ncbi:ParB/RepB/Spo0J family partition protein [Streptomyces sp. A1136]|uniref:ParB/RepB/Spo0J family partition protein n=1 Tax=Streptomyces sp. A1136 TaxID=2563102 RepID=UPI0014463848|nr:ParB/RepB/Spo0J family partition protein [Streptomyces sp. A1136]